MTQSMYDQIESSRGWLIIYRDGSRKRLNPRLEAKARLQESASTKVRRETYSEAARRRGIRLN